MKSFKYWTREEVENAFTLNRVYENFAPLQTWLAAQYEFTADERTKAADLSKNLLFHVDEWNEEELKMWFIAPVLQIINFNINSFRPFLDRPLAIKINNETSSGKVDLLIAQGKQAPKKPFFFLHEYKQENKRDNDPLGQLLIAMLAAQRQNDTPNTLYGCYVSGRNWFFVVLQEKNYSVSDAYSAANNTAFLQVLSCLFFVKTLISQYK